MLILSKIFLSLFFFFLNVILIFSLTSRYVTSNTLPCYVTLDKFSFVQVLIQVENTDLMYHISRE